MNGGAIAIDIISSEFKPERIINNYFSYNKAGQNGGAIYI